MDFLFFFFFLLTVKLDLAARNVLLSKSLKPKIVDFGKSLNIHYLSFYSLSV